MLLNHYSAWEAIARAIGELHDTLKGTETRDRRRSQRVS
jgi:hypothetical protein